MTSNIRHADEGDERQKKDGASRRSFAFELAAEFDMVLGRELDRLLKSDLDVACNAP